MKKEEKSCTGVLLRADLTGHGHPTFFGRKGLDVRNFVIEGVAFSRHLDCKPLLYYKLPYLDGCALLGQPSKGNPCSILIILP